MQSEMYLMSNTTSTPLPESLLSLVFDPPSGRVKFKQLSIFTFGILASSVPVAQEI